MAKTLILTLLTTCMSFLTVMGDTISVDSIDPEIMISHAPMDTTVDEEEPTIETIPRTEAFGQYDKVYIFELHQEIAPPATRLIRNAISAAEDAEADVILMDLDTYGGLVTDADEIRTLILRSEIPFVVFIRNNAASAGALISIACDSIYMAPGSTIGAASVVDQNGELAPEKYQSYMRKKMEETAVETGRNPEIAKGMVDDRVVIEGITADGEIITFGRGEALENGYCNGYAESIDEVVAIIGSPQVEEVTHEVSSIEGIISFLINPVVSSVLIMIIVGGLYFELKTPGVGFPLIASVVAALLYFAPHYLQGLADHWEILLFVIGIALVAVEIFVIPGFGVTGISGIVFIVAGLALALVRNIAFDFTWVPASEMGIALVMVVFPFMIFLTMFILFGQSLFERGAFKKLALESVQTADQGFIIDIKENQTALGKTGIAVTDLRPAGTIEIGNDRFDAQSDGEYIEKSTAIKVVGIHGAYLQVEQST